MEGTSPPVAPPVAPRRRLAIGFIAGIVLGGALGFLIGGGAFQRGSGGTPAKIAEGPAVTFGGKTSATGPTADALDALLDSSHATTQPEKAKRWIGSSSLPPESKAWLLEKNESP